VRRLAKASFAGSTDGTGSSRGRVRRAFAALAGTGSLALVLALVVVPAASAAPWGYEQVTPPVKGSGAVSAGDTFRTSPDGDDFLYTAVSPFSSVPAESSPQYVRYLASRGTTSWSSRAVDPPFSDPQAHYLIMQTLGSSVNLSYAVVVSTVALTPGATEGGGNLYMRDTRTGALTLIATSDNVYFAEQYTNPQGSSSIKYVAPDGRSALFNTYHTPTGATSSPAGTLYGWTEAGGLEAKSVLPASAGGETVYGSIEAGGEGSARDSLPQTDGMAHVYFGTYSGEHPGAYVRSGGETKAVSVSHIAGDPATPVPASAVAVGGGSRYMLFSTQTRLTSATPTGVFGTYVYRYDASDDSLVYIGNLGEGWSGGVVQMTQDGQTVAFKSTAALTPDTPTSSPYGVVNLYVWRDGVLHYVMTTEPESAATGSNFLRVLSTDGRYFSFTDNSKSVAAEFGEDDILSDGCPPPFSVEPGPCSEVYVYDAEAEELQCASCVPGGQVPVGDNADSNASYTRMDSHQVQSVGNNGTVYFTTPNPLLPEDRDGANDVYAYNDGDLWLVSRAIPGTSAHLLDVTPDGKTVFFSTNDALVPTDTDNAVDVYMTREGAGFPYTPPPVPPVCAGIESCHAGVPATPTQSSPGSSAFEGRGNEKPRTRKSGAKITVIKPRPATGSAGALKVKAPGKGKLTVSGAGVKKATRSVSKAGTYTVKVTLTPGAAKALQKSGQTQKKLKVTFKPSQGKASSATVKLTFKASAGKKGGR
jgi:hypothetical protein